MKVKVVLAVIIMFAGVALAGFFQAFQANAMQDQSEPDFNESDQSEILSATLQIEISIPLDARGLGWVKVYGLGSLVWDGEKTLLVTHNHWGSALQEQAVVELYDAEGRMVKTMSGSEFISLMVYLDAGTLILRSPVELKGQTQPVLESDPVQLKAGDFVMVAQHEGPEQEEVILVGTEVEAVTTFMGLPVYQLRNLKGQPAQRGDSGGGVWHEGKLMGNLWYRKTAEPTLLTHFSSAWQGETKLEATIVSYAAIFPAEQFISFQRLLADVGRRESFAVP